MLARPHSPWYPPGKYTGVGRPSAAVSPHQKKKELKNKTKQKPLNQKGERNHRCKDLLYLFIVPPTLARLKPKRGRRMRWGDGAEDCNRG